MLEDTRVYISFAVWENWVNDLIVKCSSRAFYIHEEGTEINERGD